MTGGGGRPNDDGAVALLDRLVAVVGAEHVTDDAHVLASYSTDFTDVAPTTPRYVVRPGSASEVSAVVRLLCDHGVAYHPVAGGLNNWGLHVPKQPGTVVVDVARLDRIVEVDEARGYAVIEPGVTVAALHRTLSDRGYWTGYPNAPARQATMVANLLLEGWSHAPLRFGNQSSLLTSIEAVLPDGTRLCAGTRAVTPHWAGRHSLPDLVGLFVGWHGTTGIVTKAGIHIARRPSHRQVLAYERAGQLDDVLIELVQHLLDLDVLDDLELRVHGPTPTSEHNAPAGPRVVVQLELAAHTRGLLDAKIDAIEQVVRRHRGRGGTHLIPLALTDDQRQTALRLPPVETYDRTSLYGEGWGHVDAFSYLPLDVTVPAFDDYVHVCERYGHVPFWRVNVFAGTRLAKAAHSAHVDLDDPESVARARAFTREVVQAFIDHGGTLWKAPPWVKELELGAGDPGYAATLARIKDVLDPDDLAARGNLGIR